MLTILYTTDSAALRLILPLCDFQNTFPNEFFISCYSMQLALRLSRRRAFHLV